MNSLGNTLQDFIKDIGIADKSMGHQKVCRKRSR